MSLPYNAVKRFYSDDVGAPSLAGQVGSLVSLLDAILVNGYGTVTISSITRSGSTVTVETSTAHGHAVGTVIKIAGADQTDYNGEWIVASMIDSTHLTFDCAALTPVSPATGSMTLKRAAVNWTKAFAGTNKAAYQLPVGTTQALLRIDDTVTTYANVTGYESMTDVDTGVNSYASGTSVWGKSSTADATGRPWIAYADDRFLWLLIRWHASAGRYTLYCFGDTIPTNSLDAYHTTLISDNVAGGSSPGNNGDGMSLVRPAYSNGDPLSRSLKGHRMARTYNQLGTSTAIGKLSLAVSLASTQLNSTANSWLQIGTAGLAWPAPNDNGIYVAPVLAVHSGIIRATFPGLLAPMHSVSSEDGTIYPALLPGRSVQFMLCNTTGTDYADAAFDVTGPWR